MGQILKHFKFFILDIRKTRLETENEILKNAQEKGHKEKLNVDNDEEMKKILEENVSSKAVSEKEPKKNDKLHNILLCTNEEKACLIKISYYPDIEPVKKKLNFTSSINVGQMWKKFDQFIKINPNLGVSQLKKKLIKLDKRCKKMLSRNQLEDKIRQLEEDNALKDRLLETTEQKFSDEIKELSEQSDHKFDRLCKTHAKEIEKLNKKINKLKRKLADAKEPTSKKAKNSKTMKQINEELFDI